MTTQQQVDEACRNIERSLQAFAADRSRLADLQRSLTTLQWLREQYRENKTLLTPYLERIKELSQRVHTELAAARNSLTTRYLEAIAAVAAWDETREACRDALLELATAENINRFTSASGQVEVKSLRAITLPKAGTAQRQELSAIITRAGRWPEVALPNAVRLLKAMDDGLFPAEEATHLTRLCPPQTVRRLVGHANNRQTRS